MGDLINFPPTDEIDFPYCGETVHYFTEYANNIVAAWPAQLIDSWTYTDATGHVEHYATLSVFLPAHANPDGIAGVYHVSRSPRGLNKHAHWERIGKSGGAHEREIEEDLEQ